MSQTEKDRNSAILQAKKNLKDMFPRTDSYILQCAIEETDIYHANLDNLTGSIHQNADTIANEATRYVFNPRFY